MSKPSWTIHALLTAGTIAVATLAGAQTLRFGLAEDPDILDPTLARTFVGRIVFAALCDKLFDIDEKLEIVPQLATGYEWSADRKALTIKLRKGVTFHDGEKLDAAAVKFNIERHKTMAGSNRRGELAPVMGADVVDDLTVRLNLSAPFAPLLAQLADRAGMMVSPKAAQAEGDKFGSKPVCSGPVRFVAWVAPTNAFYAKNMPVPKRDVAKAKALLQAAGVSNPSFTLMTPTTSDAQKIAQVVQSMVREAGFDVKIQSTEFATSLNMADKGDFEAYVLAWSGRADPDGNVYSFHGCKQPLDYAGYCKQDVDDLLNRSRTTLDPAERKKIFAELAAIVLKDRPIVYLFHRHWLWAYTNKLSGLRAIPDGLVRVQGLKMN